MMGNAALLSRLLVVEDTLETLRRTNPDLLAKLEKDFTIIDPEAARRMRIVESPEVDMKGLIESIRHQEAMMEAQVSYELGRPNEHGNRQQRRAWKAEQRRAAKRNRK